MKIIGVIPARWASTRLEGKILADIQGKPMIQHVWERAKRCRLLDEVMIACDDRRVYMIAKKFGAHVVLTSTDLASGTDRIAEAVKNFKIEIVINIQGDEPLIDPKTIDALAEVLIKDKTCVMVTVIKEITQPNELNNPNVVKVVIDKHKDAMYFSRSLIPFNRDSKKTNRIRYFKHLGLYGYRKKFLMRFKDLPKSFLEKVEQLEQLRVLEAGYKIKTIQTHKETISVDTPEDLEHVRELLSLQTNKR